MAALARPNRRFLFVAFSFALAAATLAAPGVAEACAVCFQAKSDASRVAFIITTAGMTFLPLAVVGGGAWWVRRRFAQAAEAEAPPGAEPVLAHGAAPSR